MSDLHVTNTMPRRIRDWHCLPLHEVAEVRTGLAVGKTDLRDPVEVPYLRVANVQDGRLNLEVVKRILVERNHLARYSLRRGDILMTEGGDFDKLGRGYVWSGQIDPCLHQNHVFAVRPKPELVDSYFLAAQAASEQGRLYFLRCAKRSTNLASINSSQLKKFPVLLPILVEQKKIARILGCWDKAIITTEQLLSNSHKQKRLLMRELLLPHPNSNDWKTYRLKDLFVERNETGCGNLPLLSITRDEGVILREDVGRKNTSNKDKSKYLRIHKGDIGYNTMRMWQGVSALSSMDGIISPAYTVVVPNEKIDAQFAAQLFKLDRVVSQFYRHSQGLVSDTWNLKFKYFSQISVSIPDRKEQAKIVSMLGMADCIIDKLTAELNKLKGEKYALLQQLVTGKRRVKIDSVA